jgi:hypothetical protein
MHYDSYSDTAAAPVRSLHGRPQVIRPEDLVWPPPLEDLQAFSVIKVGEDDERAAALLIVAGLAAPARPQPAVTAPAPTPAPAPARTAPPARTAVGPAAKPAAPRAVAKPHGTSVPAAVAPPRKATSPWALPRWARVGLFATALGLVF